MATFRDMLIDTEDALISAGVFFGHGYESAHDEAVALVLTAADRSPTDTGTEILEVEYPEQARQRLDEFVSKRCVTRLPLAYITQVAWLGPLCFKSDARALVPRSPVASLIMSGFAPWYSGPYPAVIVDVCCGGGSLGMLAKTVFPDALVVLSDLDRDALSLAQENREDHPVDGIVRADLLSWCADRSVDIILANPPYVDAEHMQDLPPEYLHEPGLALDGGDDGLDLVSLLLWDAARILKPKGLLVLEVGYSVEALENLSEDLVPLWVELEHGGEGVAIFMAQDLAQWAAKQSVS
ncbi:50S ribosomal protein L3 N(5)-glutamine methyltransferase [Luminiphilus sp.]|nr:50S ribosomal protein L3 N(5)-glutamine methyltransferase [Luminiphilus sp.]MDB2512655.1 50S ribosomal protein L3 N(5)-glutamine methyltransferase [Luminiphilus sp.]